ncbi:MAG TPA: hypothetical protein VK422_05360 [Pyrinomonadaceae bacterium]|nr:hypothetical protein [Pyrinomonadaceae bacterium]
MGQCSGGYCYFLSCGSSAGNYYMKCSQTTGICDDCEENVCNESADYQCQLRGHTKDAGPQQ